MGMGLGRYVWPIQVLKSSSLAEESPCLQGRFVGYSGAPVMPQAERLVTNSIPSHPFSLFHIACCRTRCQEQYGDFVMYVQVAMIELK